MCSMGHSQLRTLKATCVPGEAPFELNLLGTEEPVLMGFGYYPMGNRNPQDLSETRMNAHHIEDHFSIAVPG